MKIISKNEAAMLIKSHDTVAISGSGAASLIPESLLEALEERYLKDGEPGGLTIFHPQGIGDKKNGGLARLTHKGMCKRVIGGHWGMSPAMGQAADREEIEAYNLPQGIMAQLTRSMCAKGPGVISKIGIGTYIDPRQSGGRMNHSAKEDLIEVIELGGEEWLWYKPVPINVALIRGTTVDEDGYVCYEEEVHYDEVLAMAGAARNNGGIVIVQAKRVAKRESIDYAKTKIPGYLVDYVVIDGEQRQSIEFFYNPYYCGAAKQPLILQWPDDRMNERKFIARRQAMELKRGMLVNIGVGISNGVPFILAEEGLLDTITLSLEQGQSGGIPVMGLDAGTMINPRIILEHPVQHDLYHGGVLDATCLSAAEIDFHGNVNVSKMGANIPGCGGFIDISQETKTIVFGGTFCAKSKVEIKDGRVHIMEQGTIKKFVDRVQQITFNAEYAAKKGKRVVYITERGVFELTPDGIMLTEIAPGIDLERDILAQMDFRPLIADQLITMPNILFMDGPMGLASYWKERDTE